MKNSTSTTIWIIFWSSLIIFFFYILLVSIPSQNDYSSEEKERLKGLVCPGELSGEELNFRHFLIENIFALEEKLDTCRGEIRINKFTR